jgi:hypothetical protein
MRAIFRVDVHLHSPGTLRPYLARLRRGMRACDREAEAYTACVAGFGMAVERGACEGQWQALRRCLGQNR